MWLQSGHTAQVADFCSHRTGPEPKPGAGGGFCLLVVVSPSIQHTGRVCYCTREPGFPVPSLPHPPDRGSLCLPTLLWSELWETHGMEDDSRPVPRGDGSAQGCVNVAFLDCTVQCKGFVWCQSPL